MGRLEVSFWGGKGEGLDLTQRILGAGSWSASESGALYMCVVSPQRGLAPGTWLWRKNLEAGLVPPLEDWDLRPGSNPPEVRIGLDLQPQKT